MREYSLLWLPNVLRAAGLNVEEIEGWATRGHGDVSKIRGVICHHTRGPPHGNIHLRILVEGRPDLAGPLCQLGLGRDGTYFCIAAGKAWHAGNGEWQGLTGGNSHFIGIEAEHTGLPGDPWPSIQMLAYKHGVAAILRHIGAQPIMCCGHSEYALPVARKDDPSFDMNIFRADVAALMNQQLPV
jgi:N-acetylmuramoyl-L-alanine amidase